MNTTQSDFAGTDITFIIPVRHQENARNWAELRRNLACTIRSIQNQTHENWRCVIVANEGADLPPMPPSFHVKRVSFPPNLLHEQGSSSVENFREAFRLDKGRRVLAGMLLAAESAYFMIVDDDDFISCYIAEFVARNRGRNGWFIKQGLVWRAGDPLAYLHNNFHTLCGTSLIVRSSLYSLAAPLASYSDADTKRMLGSHIFIEDYLRTADAPLEALPFPGAVYRIGHTGAHSRSKGLFGTFLFKKSNLRSPGSLLSTISRFRLVHRKIRMAFSLPCHRDLTTPPAL